jgi:hypothetical protein
MSGALSAAAAASFNHDIHRIGQKAGLPVMLASGNNEYAENYHRPLI